MSTIQKVFGVANLWNTEGGPNDSDNSAITIKSTSNEHRLEAVALDGADRWDVTVVGDFVYAPAKQGFADLLSAQVTEINVLLNGEKHQYEQSSTPFDFIRWLTSYDYRYDMLGGNDTFVGSTSVSPWGDEIRGGAGNDVFTGYKDGLKDGKANYDSFFGEAGIDKAVYLGKLAEYTIDTKATIWDGRYQVQTSGTQVKDSVQNRDGTDWLKEVERLKFSDVNVAFDAGKGENAGMAYRLYKAAFDRTPDSPGLGYWVDSFDRGVSLEKVASSFIGSSEFKSLYGANTSDAAFVGLLYQHVLHRDLDAAGNAYWLAELASGVSRGAILASFSEAKENLDQTATLVANGIHYESWGS